MSTLSQHRELQQWYAERRIRALGDLSEVEHLLCAACVALSSESAATFDDWCSHLEAFCASNKASDNAVSAAEKFLAPFQLSFLEVMTQYTENVIGDVDSQRLLNTIQALADKVSFVAFRFLSAWIALNCGQKERCISECEKVDEPFGALHTIHGQALLETGCAKEAIEVLNVAVKLSPREPLAWFQLAKAHLVLNNCDAAWVALHHCEKVAGATAEIAMMRGWVAAQMHPSKNTERCQAREGLWRAYKSGYQDVQLLSLLLQLTMQTNDQIFAGDVIKDVNWGAVIEGENGFKLVTKLASKLQTQGWYNEAVLLMDRMIEVTKGR